MSAKFIPTALKVSFTTLLPNSPTRPIELRLAAASACVIPARATSSTADLLAAAAPSNTLVDALKPVAALSADIAPAPNVAALAVSPTPLSPADTSAPAPNVKAVSAAISVSVPSV